MKNEEEYIREKMGTRNPFTVPDGYFDRLSEQVICKIQTDGNRQTSMVRHLRPLLYAAACIALAVAIGAVMHTETQGEAMLMAQQQETAAYNDTYLDEMADYAMIDNDEIYASLLADL